MKSRSQIAIFTRIAAITGIGIKTKYENHNREIINTDKPQIIALIYEVAHDFTFNAVLISTAVVGSHPASHAAIFAAATHKTSFC